MQPFPKPSSYSKLALAATAAPPAAVWAIARTRLLGLLVGRALLGRPRLVAQLLAGLASCRATPLLFGGRGALGRAALLWRATPLPGRGGHC